MNLRTPISLILEAVQAKLNDAQAKLTATTVSAACAQSSWSSIKELHGFKRGEDTVIYDETEHKRVAVAYDADIAAATENVEAWREALHVVMDKFV